MLNEPHVYDLYQTQRHTALQTSTPFSDMTLFEAFTQSFLPWLNIDPMNPPPLMNEARFRVAFENAFQEVPGLVDGVRDQVMGTFRQLLDEMGVYRQRNGVIEDAALDAPVDTEDEESYAGLDGDNGEIEERE